MNKTHRVVRMHSGAVMYALHADDASPRIFSQLLPSIFTRNILDCKANSRPLTNAQKPDKQVKETSAQATSIEISSHDRLAAPHPIPHALSCKVVILHMGT